MFHQCFLRFSAVLSIVVPMLVAMETCPSTGIPGIPGMPGMPGKDGRDGDRGENGQQGAAWDGVKQKGQKGEQGLLGFSGKRGQSGDPGPPGFPGIAGPPGEPGDVRTASTRQKAAFSMARGVNDHPEKTQTIKFTKEITNINGDYNTTTGRFKCRIPGTYYFVFHASMDNRLCVLMKMNENLLTSFCDHRRLTRQVTSGSLAVYLSKGQEVWLETGQYRAMKGNVNGYSIFSGFLLQPH